MTCEGCPNHNFSSDRLPLGNDDPCNTSGQGIFCPGSYWLYDNTISSDTDIYGDCPRLFQRIGDTCAVSEWIEIPISEPRYENTDPTDTDCCPAGTLWINENTGNTFISYADFRVIPPVCNWCQICNNLISDVVAPVDGADCHPPGTIWCIPAGTDGSVINELYISTNGCDDCTWCLLCGRTLIGANYTGPDITLLEGVQTIIPYDLLTIDYLNEFTTGAGPGHFAPKRLGIYQVCVSTSVIGDALLTSPIIQSIIYRNGVVISVVSEHYGLTIPTIGIGTVYKGCAIVRATNPGDVFDIRVTASNLGGVNLSLTNLSQNLQIKRLSD